MPGMPDLMQKSPIMRRFELFSRMPGSQNSQRLADAINRLGGDPTAPDNQLLKIAEDLGFYDASHPSAHFRTHWLGLPPAADPFWPTIQQEVNDKIRAGMLKTCQLFQTTGHPVEFWWIMSGAEGTTDWQMSVTDFGERILAVFHTPTVPCDEPLKDSQFTWVVTTGDAGDVVTRPAKVPQSAEQPDPVGLALAAKRKVVAKRPKRHPVPGPKKGKSSTKRSGKKKKSPARGRGR